MHQPTPEEAAIVARLHATKARLVALEGFALGTRVTVAAGLGAQKAALKALLADASSLLPSSGRLR